MSFSSWLRALKARLERSNGRRPRPAPRTRRRGAALALERLEDRTVPSTVSWINAAGGDWDNAANWSTGMVPTATDDVVIEDASITVVSGRTRQAHSLSGSGNLRITGGTLRLGEESSLGGLDLRGGVPEPARTMVIVPTLISSVEGARALVEHLEVQAIGNMDPHLHFALLTDFPDAAAEHMAGEDEVLAAAVERRTNPPGSNVPPPAVSTSLMETSRLAFASVVVA